MASRTVTVGSTGGLHARPAAMFVAAAQALPVPVTIRTAEKPAVPAGSMLSVLALRATFGTQVTLEAAGEGAEAALDQLAALLVQNLDQETQSLQGIGVSPGMAAGPAFRLVAPQPLPPPRAVPDTEAEAAIALVALRNVSADLSQRATAAADPVAAQILRAQIMMIDDPVLEATVTAAAQSGMDAAHAIEHSFAAHRRTFAEAGGYLTERITDLDDLRDRAIAGALGNTMPGIPNPGTPFILVAHDLAPADTASLDPTQVLAIVTERGGPTSHMAILARSMGVPAVVMCPKAMDIPDGTTITVDGSSGAIVVGAGQSAVDTIRQSEQQRRTALAASAGTGRTADGHAIALLANIGSAHDLEDPSALDIEGVGLFRTELLYLDRAQTPGLDEQIATYARVFALNRGRRMIVRTLDSGADKPLPFLHHEAEPNPALGIRGSRLARRNPEILQTQLAAIAAASHESGADVWVMAPMIATAGEAAAFTALCRAAGLPHAGVMVEIPSAALQVASILAECDFISIGTNDLSQYTFAADRECGDLAELNDPWQPALLQLIERCGRAGAAVGKPVGICGAAASDPALAPVLVGLGATSLSMPARAIAACRESLAQLTLAQCQQRSAAALAATEAVTARAAAGL